MDGCTRWGSHVVGWFSRKNKGESVVIIDPVKPRGRKRFSPWPQVAGRLGTSFSAARHRSYTINQPEVSHQADRFNPRRFLFTFDRVPLKSYLVVSNLILGIGLFDFILFLSI